MKATSEFGIPSHVRSDKGFENMLVALSQLGTNRNSMLTGRSVHNQRIERYALILCDTLLAVCVTIILQL